MEHDVILYKNSREEYPVKTFINKQNARIQSTFSHLINLLITNGPNLGMPYSKKIDKNLYELRGTGKTPI